MATVFLLNISDPIVAPCLELIRRICNPESTSKPHITVRYIKKLKDNNFEIYEDIKIPYVDILHPGSFGLNNQSNSHNRVVFLKCASDDLERLAYKPHFPDSIFHITLYEGSDEKFAKNLFALINQFTWNFRLELPIEDNRLSTVRIKNDRKRTSEKSPKYSPQVKAVHKTIFNEELSIELLQTLTESEVLARIKAICQFIQDHAQNHAKSLNRQAHAVNYEPHIIPEIGASWIKKTDPEAKQVGLYLTPPELATEITAYSIEIIKSIGLDIHFGDPAVGTGVFFSALLHQVEPKYLASAIGIELNENRAKATRNRWGHLGLQVEIGDYLHIDNLPERTLLLANPPYVRYQNIDPNYARGLREKAAIESGMKISGQSGLYVYFILASHGWMAENGVAAWLIPSEFMESNYGDVVRKYLTKHVTLVRVHQYDDKKPQFENAKVSSCVVVFINKRPRNDNLIEFSIGGSIQNPSSKKTIKLHSLKIQRRWTMQPSDVNSDNKSSIKIGDLFIVKRGIATGANDYFIMTSAEAETRKIPHKLLKPVLPKSLKLKGSVIEAEDNGYPKTSPNLFVFDSDHENPEYLSDSQKFKDYIKLARQTGVRDRTLVRKRKIWCQQEKRQPTKFICTYMGRGSQNTSPIRFLFNKSNAIATNSYLMMYPKPRLAAILNSNSKLEEKLFEILKATETEISNYWRNYVGGLRKIEPKDLLEVPLAELPNWLEPIVDGNLFD